MCATKHNRAMVIFAAEKSVAVASSKYGFKVEKSVALRVFSTQVSTQIYRAYEKSRQYWLCRKSPPSASRRALTARLFF
jgi:hypothetical protein